MKRALLLLLFSTTLSFSLNARTTPREGSARRKGSAAAYSTFDSTALSMLLWGTGLAVVIVTAAILIPSSSSGDSNHSHS